MNPQTKTFAAGSHLFHENDRSRELYIVQTGNVKVYRTQNGREIELAVLGKGSVAGEMALIDGRPRSASAKALDECTATIIDADVFHTRIKGVPGWFMTICKMTCQKIRNANRLLQSMGGGRHGINIILALNYEFARAGECLSAPETRRRLSGLLGASESNIARLCGFLDANGFLEYSETDIRLRDKNRLNEYCDFLRFFIRKIYERAAPPPEKARILLMALAEKHPELLESADAAVLGGDDLWPLVREQGLDREWKEILPFFEDGGLFKIAKKEGGAGSGEKGADENPLAGASVQIDSGLLKQWYLFNEYNGMIPAL